MRKLPLVLFVVTVFSSPVFANPVNKLCRASTLVKSAFAQYLADSRATEPKSSKLSCYHAGRIAGAVEEGMTFRDQAREKTPPALLALADEAVAEAAKLRPICLAPENPANDYVEVWNKLWTLAGDNAESLSSRIFAASCGGK